VSWRGVGSALHVRWTAPNQREERLKSLPQQAEHPHRTEVLTKRRIRKRAAVITVSALVAAGALGVGIGTSAGAAPQKPPTRAHVSNKIRDTHARSVSSLRALITMIGTSPRVRSALQTSRPSVSGRPRSRRTTSYGPAHSRALVLES
jgi:hypothetical protein